MTFGLPPPHSASLRFVLEASRPGSIESRQIHGCTCVPNDERRAVWNPDEPQPWFRILSLDCPAHGRLLERAERDVHRPWQLVQTTPRYRPWRERFVDGLRKLVRRVRGVKS